MTTPTGAQIAVSAGLEGATYRRLGALVFSMEWGASD